MPIPDKPYTRREAYLNAAATGDSGSIPETPYTREEMYLDAIARNGGGGGGSSTLAGLTDVDISNPSDGQTLVYNATSGKWENGSGSGGGVLVVQGSDGVCNKTTREMLAAMEAGGVSIKIENQPGYYSLDVVNGVSVWDNAGTKTYEFYTAARTYTSTSLDDYPSA